MKQKKKAWTDHGGTRNVWTKFSSIITSLELRFELSKATTRSKRAEKIREYCERFAKLKKKKDIDKKEELKFRVLKAQGVNQFEKNWAPFRIRDAILYEDYISIKLTLHSIKKQIKQLIPFWIWREQVWRLNLIMMTFSWTFSWEDSSSGKNYEWR